MKNLRPVVFTDGRDEDDGIADFRPKVRSADDNDPKDLPAQESVNKSPPEKTPSLSTTVPVLNKSQENSTLLVSSQELKGSLQDDSEENVSAEKEQTEN